MDSEEPFSVAGSVAVKAILFSPSCGWPLWTLLGIGLALVAAGCVHDMRLMVLGLMICVAFTPCLAVFMYFSYTMSPGIVQNFIPHTLERCDGGFLVRVWHMSAGEEEEEERKWVESGSFRLYDSDIVDRKTSFEYETLYFKDSRMKILYVPRFRK